MASAGQPRINSPAMAPKQSSSATKTDLLDIHAREIQSLYPGVEVHARKVDAAEESDVEGLVNEVLEKYGRLDIFFANAGITTGMERITEASADNFMKAMRTNALG
jgi:NAD(P)-dependent dehydrogenase (short-subunit alcohol dehydrogenase family)